MFEMTFKHADNSFNENELVVRFRGFVGCERFHAAWNTLFIKIYEELGLLNNSAPLLHPSAIRFDQESQSKCLIASSDINRGRPSISLSRMVLK